MKLRGKNIILTGAASGIGRELLHQLVGIECRVIAVDLRTNTIPTADRITPYACDLSQPEAVDALFDFALTSCGSVDVFIANAGFAYYEEIGRPDWKRIAKIYEVNTFSPFYAAQKMKEINLNRPYSVAVTASAMAFMSLPGYALYSSTKAAVRGFAEAYRFELGRGQRFQVIYPIATRTNFFSEAGGSPVPFPSQDAAVVGRRIIRGIERERNNIFPSRMFRIMIFKNRFLPFLLWAERMIELMRFRKWRHERMRDGESSPA